MYGIRITDLYQLIGLIIQDMPHLPIENILSMLHRLAEAIDLQKQMVSSTSNKSPLKSSVIRAHFFILLVIKNFM